jgi:hypothetical protein
LFIIENILAGLLVFCGGIYVIYDDVIKLKKNDFYEENNLNVYTGISSILAILPKPIDYFLYKLIFFIAGFVSCYIGIYFILFK